MRALAFPKEGGQAEGQAPHPRNPCRRPGPSTRASSRRSRMPVMGLVRLQRALGGAIPPFDPILPRWRQKAIPEDGRHGHGPRGDAVCSCPVGEQVFKALPAGGSEGSNACRAGGLHAGWETIRRPSGETWDGWYSWGQPREIDGQLKPVIAPMRVHLGEQEPAPALQWPAIDAGSRTVSKGAALEPRAPEICDERASGSNRPGEALAVCS